MVSPMGPVGPRPPINVLWAFPSQSRVFSGSVSRLGVWRFQAPVISLSPSLPASFLLSWQRLYPVALNKAQEKGQQRVIVLGMKTNEPLSAGLLASCWRKERTMLRASWLCWPLEGLPHPFPVQRLSAPKPPLPEESLDARVRCAVPPAQQILVQARLRKCGSESPGWDPGREVGPLPSLSWCLGRHCTSLGLCWAML